jgi:hypothetical protein
MRHVYLALVLVGGAACSSDPCNGRSGTCITLTVEGAVHGLDQLAVTVDKPTSETQTTRPTAVSSLPAQVGLNLPATVVGPVSVSVAALAHGTVIAHGSGLATVSHNRGAVTVDLTPGVAAGDMASAIDSGPRDGGGSDGGGSDGGASDGGGDGGDDGGGPSVPSAPVNVVASSGNAQATVTWSAPASSGSSPITAYTVTSTSGNIKLSTGDGMKTTLTVGGLTNGMTYSFDVVASNGSGSGPAARSNPVTPTATPMVPAPPTNVVAVADIDHGAHVSWTAADNRGSPISSYSVVLQPDGRTFTTNDGMTTSLQVASLIPGSQYTFIVTASNGIGTSLASTASTPITAATLPGAPTAVTASANGNSGATVSWTAPSSDGFSAITSYTVSASPGGITVKTSDGKTTGTMSGLTQGVPYTFTVTANNIIGAGPASTASSALTLPMHDTLAILSSTNSNSGAIDFYDSFNSLPDGTSTPSRSVALNFAPGFFAGSLAIDGVNGIVYVSAINAGHVYGWKNAPTLHGNAPTPDIDMNVFTTSNPPIAVDTARKKLYVTEGTDGFGPNNFIKLERFAWTTSPTELSTAKVEATITMSSGTAYQIFINPANGDAWVACGSGGGPGVICYIAGASTAADGSGCTKTFNISNPMSFRAYTGLVYVPGSGGEIFVSDGVQGALDWLANINNLASNEYNATGNLFGYAQPSTLALDGNQLLMLETTGGTNVLVWTLPTPSGNPVKTITSPHGNAVGLVYIP